MSVEDIIKKHNYNDELANLLRKTYPLLCSYYKDEELVFNALYSAPIVLCSNVYDYLFEENLIEDDDNAIVDKNSLRQAAGVYCSKPRVKYHELERKYTIEGVDRVVAINASTLEYDKTQATLIHELCNLIKSYYNEYSIKADTLTEKSGLIIKRFHLQHDNGKVKRSMVSENAVGLEEGMNTLAEEEITSLLQGKDHKSYEYSSVMELAKKVIGLREDIKSKIIESELYHDETLLQSQFGESYYHLIDFSDKLYKLNLEVINFNLSSEDIKIKEAEIKKFIYENYPQVIQMMGEAISNKDNRIKGGVQDA